MARRLTTLTTLLAVLVTFWAAGCSRKQPAITPEPGKPAKEPADRKAPGGGADAPSEKPRGDKEGGRLGLRAVLIGTTHYPSLAERLQLTGPGNDVLVMADLLHDQYGFPRENITILAEAEGKKDVKKFPTRANIERELRRLAREARAGDQVVVLLAGHGSLTPAKEGAEGPPSDGLERLYLPRDIGKWEGASGAVPNAIRGQEIGDWLRPIAKKNAYLWVIVDACHSGEMIRAVDERARQVPVTEGLGVPEAALERARDLAAKRKAKGPEKTRGREALAAPLRLAQEKGVVLTYACQSSEVTVERLFPPYGKTGADKQFFGLLTYTLNTVVRSAATHTKKGAAPRNLTHRQLVTLIQRHYTALGRTSPTPVIEGDADRSLLGRKSLTRSNIYLAEKDEKLVINAGRLHGLTAGSVLAVYPAPGQPRDDEVLGHVRITARIKATESEVEACEYEKVKAPDKALLAGPKRCELVELSLGDLKLGVAVDRKDNRGKDVPEAERQKARRVLDKVAKGPRSLIKVVADSQNADWLVRVDGEKVYLVPAPEWSRAWEGDAGKDKGKGAGEGKRTQRSANFDAKLGDWLSETFARLARAKQLVRLAAEASAAPGATGDFGAQARVELRLLRDEKDTKGVLLPGPVRKLYPGDVVRYTISNPGEVSVDVTVLYVDSQFNIEAFFPPKNAIVNNRLAPGQTKTISLVDVTADTTGPEYVVVLAVKAERSELPVDFTSLAQPTAEAARKVESKRGGDKGRGLGSPLGKLLQRALYREGDKGKESRRGQRPREREDFVLDLIPVQIEPADAPGEHTHYPRGCRPHGRTR